MIKKLHQGERCTRLPASTHLHDALIAINWLAWLMYAFLTLGAFVEEMFTLFIHAGFGYYFIMLGMPAYMFAWLCFVVYASFRPVPTSWLLAVLVVAALVIVGYMNIG